MRGLGSGNFGFLLRKTLGKDSLVLCPLFFLNLEPSALEGAEVAAALKSEGGNKALDLGSIYQNKSTNRVKRIGKHSRKKRRNSKLLTP